MAEFTVVKPQFSVPVENETTTVSENDTVVLSHVADGIRIGLDDRGYGVVAVGGTSAELKDLWVSPSERGKGYGTLLLERAEDLARTSGAEYIYLTADLKDGAHPYNFYTKMGYSPVISEQRASIQGRVEKGLPISMEKFIGKRG